MQQLKIDFHTHILPENIPEWGQKFGYQGFIQLKECGNLKERDMVKDTGQFFRRIESNCYCGDDRLPDMDKHNVEIQVLSTVPVMFSYWAKPEDCYEVSQFLNDHISQVCKSNPKRFLGLGTLPLNDVDLSKKELLRCIKDLGFKGIQIGTNINGENLDSERLFPLYQLAEELDIVIFVHPWDILAADRMKNYWLPWLVGMPAETAVAIHSLLFGGVFQKFPNLKWVFAHGGGSFIPLLGRIEHGYNMRQDLFPNKCNPRDYLKNIYVDSHTCDEDILLLLVKTLGSDHIVIGSDYPFPLGELEPGLMVQECKQLSNEQKRQICYENAVKLLKLQ